MARTPDRNTDKALEYMDENYPGPHSFATIGAFCGCSSDLIEEIYKSAMRKLRVKIEKKDLDG